MSKQYLIVEGYFDKLFYSSLLPKIGRKDINITTPNRNGTGYNGKHNAIDLCCKLIDQMLDGSIDKIGLIIDSDFNDISSQGFVNSLDYIKAKLSDKGFDIKTKPVKYNDGLHFYHSGLNKDIALWLMPDNKNDGYLEYLLFEALTETKSDLTAEAIQIISSLKNKEYPSHHECKAKLAIAMSMLDNPGRNITHLIEKDIVNLHANKKMDKLLNFLTTYFN